MKILHFSDTHLGFSDYTRIDRESGLNQREQDFYDAWNRIVEEILIRKPEVVVHAGDLFHSSRPSNRALRVAFEGVQKITLSGIPVILISGNHSTPRIRSTGSIFETLSLVENVYAAYQGKYERFRIGETDFHCIPHCSLSEELESAFQSIEIRDAQKNVLVTHGAWSGKQEFSMGEFNEQRISDPTVSFGLKFDYIALGHYHRHIFVSENAAYSGSTERTSFNEAGYSSGFLWVDLDSGMKEYISIPSRPMIRIPAVDCSDLDTDAIYQKLEELSSEIPEGALVQLSLQNIVSEIFLRLDMKEIDRRFAQVLYLEKQFTRREADSSGSISGHIESLDVEFERFVTENNPDKTERKRLIELGKSYLV